MARIAGIVTQKNIRGEITHVTINIKKVKRAIPMLKELGIMEKTKFEKDCEGAMSVNEARARTKEFIKTLPWKK